MQQPAQGYGFPCPPTPPTHTRNHSRNAKHPRTQRASDREWVWRVWGTVGEGDMAGHARSLARSPVGARRRSRSRTCPISFSHTVQEGGGSLLCIYRGVCEYCFSFCLCFCTGRRTLIRHTPRPHSTKWTVPYGVRERGADWRTSVRVDQTDPSLYNH